MTSPIINDAFFVLSQLEFDQWSSRISVINEPNFYTCESLSHLFEKGKCERFHGKVQVLAENQHFTKSNIQKTFLLSL